MDKYVIYPQEGDCSEIAMSAIKYCRTNDIKRLVMKKGEYHFYPDKAAEAENCCVSNHGHNGYKRTAFLIEDMQNFEIECSDSLLVFHGAMNAFIVRNCTNIKIKNCRMLTERTNHKAFIVDKSCREYVDLVTTGEKEHFYMYGGLLYLQNEQGIYDYVYTCEELDKDTLEHVSGEQCFGADFLTLKNEELPDGKIRIYHPPRIPKKNNIVVLVAAERYANAVLFTDSKDIRIENCCVYSCFGVAYHFQKCENVVVYKCGTELYEGRYFSANADALHMVGCYGNVEVKECSFRHQFDDGINIHSVFTKIIEKTDDYIIVKYVNDQCRGIGLFQDGCSISILNKDSLIPYMNYKVVRTEAINTQCVKLYLNGSTNPIKVGDIADSVDFYPDVIIENCRFENNRARGILIGSKKKTVIRNNYFHICGTAVKLESDCNYWYESGGIGELVIENNIFDRCLRAERNWGNEIIYATPRNKTEAGKYYHGKIIIRNNDFSSTDAVIADIENVKEIEITDNKLNDFPETFNLRHYKNCNIHKKEIKKQIN